MDTTNRTKEQLNAYVRRNVFKNANACIFIFYLYNFGLHYAALLHVNHSTPNPITLTLTWSPPDPSYRNGVLRGYMVVITELETSRTQQFSTSAPPLSIPSLHPFYTYNCTVSAYTVGLPGPYSPPYLVRMPQSGEWYLME